MIIIHEEMKSMQVSRNSHRYLRAATLKQCSRLRLACPALHDLLKISQRLCDYIDCEIVRSSGESLSCSVFDSDEWEKNCLGVSKYVLNASLGQEGFVWNSVFGTEFTFWFGIHPKFCSKTHQFSDNIAQKIEKSVWAKIPAVQGLEIVYIPRIWSGFWILFLLLKLNTTNFLPMKRLFCTVCQWRRQSKSVRSRFVD